MSTKDKLSHCRVKLAAVSHACLTFSWLWTALMLNNEALNDETQHTTPATFFFSSPQTYDYGGERLSWTVARGIIGIHRTRAKIWQWQRNKSPVYCCRDDSCVSTVKQLPGLLHTPPLDHSCLEWIWKLQVWRHMPAAFISFACFVAQGRPMGRCLNGTRSVTQSQVKTDATGLWSQACTRIPGHSRALGQSTVFSLKGTDSWWPPLWSFLFVSDHQCIVITWASP